TIQGTTLSAGKHDYSELAASFPQSFVPGGSGSISIQQYDPPPARAPILLGEPTSLSQLVGVSAQLIAVATGTAPLYYQWQKGTNGVFIMLTDSPRVFGATSNVLSFSPLALADTGDYRLIVTNSLGTVTSAVATVTVGAVTGPTIASLNPQSNARLSSLNQI